MLRACVLVILFVINSPAEAQPPAPLPPGLTQTGATTSPLAKYSNPAVYPPETIAVADQFMATTKWMSRMHQVHGRFLPGINPALAMKLEQDPDEAQALAAWAMTLAAKMTNDPAITAKAMQTILAVSATAKTPNAATAAALSLAMRDLPGTDAKLLTAAEQYSTMLKTAANAEGMLVTDGPMAGVIISAVARSLNDWNVEWLVRVAKYYRVTLKAKPNAALAGYLLSGLVDAYSLTKDQTVAACVFELADAVVAGQYTASTGTYPRVWLGAVAGTTEPGFETLAVAHGLAATARLTRQSTNDFNRFATYKKSLQAVWGFAIALPYTDENTPHFEAKFRMQFLVGGCKQSLTNGTIRLDATAWQIISAYYFLQSGVEGRE